MSLLEIPIFFTVAFAASRYLLAPFRAYFFRDDFVVGFWFTIVSCVVVGAVAQLDTLNQYTAVLCGFLLGLGEPASRKPSIVLYSDADDCGKVIKALVLPKHAQKNRLTAHEARAGPNQRLKKFFGIDNCFTSTDSAGCTTFRNQVESLLYVEENEWKEFATAARLVARRELNPGSIEQVSLFDFVQMVTMKTMLRVLFHMDPHETAKDNHVRNLAKEINMRWLQSKASCVGDDDTSWRMGEGYALYLALRQVFPGWNEADSKANPLNLILPGYETMWRVVLRCFIEVTSRGHPNAKYWSCALQHFVVSPSEEILSTAVPTKDGASAKNIATEALRLYPPTRRIYRNFKDNNGRIVQAAADVEALHRNSDPLWGDSSQDFRPERWHNMIEAEWSAHYMHFGARPFACPAKRANGVPMPFGVTMIALLVGALLLEVGDNWELRADLPEKSVPLDTGREAYSTAVLVKMKPRSAISREWLVVNEACQPTLQSRVRRRMGIESQR